jgi:hypothetical protein
MLVLRPSLRSQYCVAVNRRRIGRTFSAAEIESAVLTALQPHQVQEEAHGWMHSLRGRTYESIENLADANRMHPGSRLTFPGRNPEASSLAVVRASTPARVKFRVPNVMEFCLRKLRDPMNIRRFIAMGGAKSIVSW